MNIRIILIALLMAILSGCEQEGPPPPPSETGEVVLNFVIRDLDIESEELRQYTMQVFSKESGKILSGQIGRTSMPLILGIGYYTIEITSPVVYKKDNAEYRYHASSGWFKVEKDTSIVVPLEFKLIPYYVETDPNQ